MLLGRRKARFEIADDHQRLALTCAVGSQLYKIL